MRVSIIMGTTLALALAGCHSGGKVTADNASSAEVAQKVKASGVMEKNFVSPGRWETTMTIDSMDIPGMPPEATARMKGAMGKGHTMSSCVTPEQAKKPKEDFFAGNQMKQCRYEHFSMGDGKIDMVMHCDTMGQKRIMKMNGTYSTTAYHMDMESNGEGDAKTPGANMTMKMHMDAKRTGECTGKEDFTAKDAEKLEKAK